MKGLKTGGRSAGTPNKVTAQLRNELKEMISKELLEVPELLQGLSPVERLDYLIKLMPYCMPKVESIKGNYDENILESFDWKLDLPEWK